MVYILRLLPAGTSERHMDWCADTFDDTLMHCNEVYVSICILQLLGCSKSNRPRPFLAIMNKFQKKLKAQDCSIVSTLQTGFFILQNYFQDKNFFGSSKFAF